MEKNKIKKKSEFMELVQTAIFSFIFVLILTTFFIKPVRVYGNSMYPTLHDKDTGFSSIISVTIGGIDRFDIVVAEIPGTSEYLVKRVIALPNEELCYENDKLYIDGQFISEDFFDSDYLNSYEVRKAFTSNVSCMFLQDDEYFLMGDNRPYSTDSRYYGTFNRHQIVSKGVFVLWPFSEFGVK